MKEERRPPSEFPTVDTEDEEDDLPITERERNLEGLTSAFDLALFREAQAQASEVSCKQIQENIYKKIILFSSSPTLYEGMSVIQSHERNIHLFY